jgi:hypothetical protein
LRLKAPFDTISVMKAKLTMELGLYVHEGQPVDDLLDTVMLDRDARARSSWSGCRFGN